MFAKGSDASTGKLLVCVVERNPLAVSQLRRILRAKRNIKVFHPPESFRDEVISDCVFVVDRGTLSVPLSIYLVQIRTQYPRARILVIDQAFTNNELILLLSAGVHGVLTYSEIDNKLVRTICSLAAGRLKISQEILEQYVERSLFYGRKKKRGGLLTAQEERIVELVKQHLSNKEIAATLQISESTVKFHMSNIFGKLGIKTRALIPGLASVASSERSMIA